MIAEDLLRDALVLAERQPGGAAAGKRHATHGQERNDVLVERAVVLELIGQVEDHVRLERLQLLLQQIEIVEDCQMLGGMTELAKRVEDVGFRLPIVRLQLRAQVLIERRRRDGVEEREDFQFLSHSAISFV